MAAKLAMLSLGVERVYPHCSKAERKDIVEYYLMRVGLGDSMHKRAASLSSGMQQRVGTLWDARQFDALGTSRSSYGCLETNTRYRRLRNP